MSVRQRLFLVSLWLGFALSVGFIMMPIGAQGQDRIQENGVIEAQQGVQKSNSAKTILYDANEPPKAPASYIPPHDYREIVLSLLVLSFGVILTLLQHRVLLKRPQDISQEGILVLHSVTLIVVATLFLITAGYTERQVAPAMGLFGTIIGYILGKRATLSQKPSKNGKMSVRGEDSS